MYRKTTKKWMQKIPKNKLWAPPLNSQRPPPYTPFLPYQCIVHGTNLAKNITHTQHPHVVASSFNSSNGLILQLIFQNDFSYFMYSSILAPSDFPIKNILLGIKPTKRSRVLKKITYFSLELLCATRV
jgi:hypothetical protein